MHKWICQSDLITKWYIFRPSFMEFARSIIKIGDVISLTRHHKWYIPPSGLIKHLLMLQSLPVHLEWHMHFPRSALNIPWPEQSGRHWYRTSFRSSQFVPIHPMSQMQVASWQTPWPLQLGSSQSPNWVKTKKVH